MFASSVFGVESSGRGLLRIRCFVSSVCKRWLRSAFIAYVELDFASEVVKDSAWQQGRAEWPGNMDTRSPPERVVIVVFSHGCDGQSTRVYEQALPYVRRWPCRNMWILVHFNAWTWLTLSCLRLAGHFTQVCDEHAQSSSAQQLPLEVLDIILWRLKVRMLCVFDRNSQRIRLMKSRRYPFFTYACNVACCNWNK
jgi:hypothetical protein